MLFLADESCDFAVVRALRAVGHDVRAVAEVCSGGTDREVIDLAIQEGRILLTEDKDFGQLFFAEGLTKSGVILIRFPFHLRQNLPKIMQNFIDQIGMQLTGRFVVMQPGRIRITKP
jgi:predicted nuclease of predicted toxin-antitoxin system